MQVLVHTRRDSYLWGENICDTLGGNRYGGCCKHKFHRTIFQEGIFFSRVETFVTPSVCGGYAGMLDQDEDVTLYLSIQT